MVGLRAGPAHSDSLGYFWGQADAAAMRRVFKWDRASWIW